MAEYILSVTNNLYPYQSTDCVSEIFAPTYGTLQEAHNYLSRKLNNEAWLEAIPEKRLAAITEATRIIDTLNFRGKKYISTQLLQFPRTNDTTVPYDIKIACYEIALRLLDGFDPEYEVENLGSTNQGVGGLRDTYDRSFVLEHIRSGVPSPRAWALLKPYLVDPRTVIISRVN